MSEVVTDTPDGLRVQEVLAETIAEMIAHRDYPCLGARSVQRRARATVRGCDRLADPAGPGRGGASGNVNPMQKEIKN